MTGRSPSLTRRQRRAGMLFVLPATAYVVVFHLFPVLYGLYLSLTEYNPVYRDGPQFVGLSNYTELMTDGDFLRSLRITAQYLAEVLPVVVVLALGLALLLNRPFPGVSLLRAAIYLPRIVSLTAISVIWFWLYSSQGLVNYLFDLVGLDPRTWLSDPDTALHSLAIMRVWSALGGNMVLFLAALQNVPKDLYEAARVDGAGAWAQFRYVTLPGIRNMTVFVVAIDIIYLAQSFAEMYIMTAGGPLQSTTTTNLLIYKQAFEFNQLGMASASAFVLFALIFVFALTALRTMGRQS